MKCSIHRRLVLLIAVICCLIGLAGLTDMPSIPWWPPVAEALGEPRGGFFGRVTPLDPFHQSVAPIDSEAAVAGTVPRKPGMLRRTMKGFVSKLATAKAKVRGVMQRVKQSIHIRRSGRRTPATVLVAHQGTHMEMDIDLLPLTPAQRQRLDSTYSTLLSLLDDSLRHQAQATHMPISRHLVYRYLEATDWADKYNDLVSFEQAIIDTIQWRYAFGVHQPRRDALALQSTGLCYVSNQQDKRGRPMLTLKINRLQAQQDLSQTLQLLMYNVERLDRASISQGVGEFILVLDLADFSWKTCLPVHFIHQSLTLLKSHYPYRLNGVYLLNAGTAFSVLWRLLKPVIPSRVLEKTFLPSPQEQLKVLDEHIGLEHVEKRYGGLMEGDEGLLPGYLDGGYWKVLQ